MMYDYMRILSMQFYKILSQKYDTYLFTALPEKMPTFMTLPVIPLHQSYSQAARILSSLLKCPFFYSRFLSFCNLPRGPSHIRYWRHIGLQLSFSDTGRSHSHPKHVGMFDPPAPFPQSLILSSSSSLWLSLKASFSKSSRFIWGIIFDKSKFGFDPPHDTVRRFPLTLRRAACQLNAIFFVHKCRQMRISVFIQENEQKSHCFTWTKRKSKKMQSF